MEKLNVSKVFILHVKKGYENRLESIQKQMSNLGIDYELMLDGDIADIVDYHKERYFKGELVKNVNAVTSCALKHILICEEIVKHGYSDCLIFEDDIILSPNFVEVFNNTMNEIISRPDINQNRVYISYENSRMKLIPLSQRIKGQFLYKADSTRYTGAIYYTNQVAQSILNYTLENKCDNSIDWYLTRHQNDFNMDIYWCQPTIAEQGSHSGRFNSGITQKKGNLFRKIAWNSQKLYKSITVRLK